MVTLSYRRFHFLLQEAIQKNSLPKASFLGLPMAMFPAWCPPGDRHGMEGVDVFLFLPPVVFAVGFQRVILRTLAPRGR